MDSIIVVLDISGVVSVTSCDDGYGYDDGNDGDDGDDDDNNNNDN